MTKMYEGRFIEENRNAAGDFLKGVKVGDTTCEKECGKHISNFSKYHQGLVKNIEKELNKSQI